MKKQHVFLLTLGLLTAFPEWVSAQAQSSQWRLHLDSTLFSFSKTTIDLNLLPGDSGKVHTTNVGLGDNMFFNAPMFGFGIGFLPLKNLVIGAKLGVGGGARNMDDDEFPNLDLRQFAYAVLPYLEYRFLSGRIQPCVLIAIGYRGSASWYDGTEDQVSFQHLFEFGGFFGAHFFLVEHVSIDTSIGASGDFGRIISADNGVGSEKWDVKGFQLALLVGLSAWI